MSKCSIKVKNPKGVKLSGTAALLHYLKNEGGFDAWYLKESQKIAALAYANLLSTLQQDAASEVYRTE